MAHWHDYNPWACDLVYLPDLEFAAACCATGEPIRNLQTGESVPYDEAYLIDRWTKTAKLYGTPNKLDAYLLKDGPQSKGPRGFYLGVRWGKEPEQYFSPEVSNVKLATELYEKFRGKP